MTKTEKRWRFFMQVSALVILCEFKNIRIVPISFYRSAEEQAKRYAQGRTEPGKIVTQRDGYKTPSAHQSSLAIDFAIMNVERNDFIWEYTDQYRQMGELGEKLGLEWGFRWYEKGLTSFKDIYHIQYKD